MFVLETLAGSPEIDDRKQHEDERLNKADEDDVERLPEAEQQGTDHRASNDADDGERERAEARDQADHHRTREDVAKESKRQRDRFDQLFENDERRVDGATPD